MKKLINLFMVAVMMFSIVFISNSVSSKSPFSVQAQQVTVKKKRRPGIARSTYRGGKWVVKKTYKTGRKVVSRTKKIVY